MIFTFTVLQGRFKMEQRIVIITALSVSLRILKLAYAPDIDYLFILTDQPSQVRIRNSALFNGLVIIVLFALNFFVLWRCHKCSRPPSYFKRSSALEREETHFIKYKEPGFESVVLTNVSEV